MSASPSARKSFRSINGRKQLKQPNGLLPWRAGAGELTFGWSICDTGILTSRVMSPGALVLTGAEQLLSEAQVSSAILAPHTVTALPSNPLPCECASGRWDDRKRRIPPAVLAPSCDISRV